LAYGDGEELTSAARGPRAWALRALVLAALAGCGSVASHPDATVTGAGGGGGAGGAGGGGGGTGGAGAGGAGGQGGQGGGMPTDGAQGQDGADAQGSDAAPAKWDIDNWDNAVWGA